jgi:hypothetical protein
MSCGKKRVAASRRQSDRARVAAVAAAAIGIVRSASAIQKVDAALGRLGAPASAAAPPRRFDEAELHADEVVERVNTDVDRRPVTLLPHSRGAY